MNLISNVNFFTKFSNGIVLDIEDHKYENYVWLFKPYFSINDSKSKLTLLNLVKTENIGK